MTQEETDPRQGAKPNGRTSPTHDYEGALLNTQFAFGTGAKRLPFVKFDDVDLSMTSDTFVHELLSFGGFSVLYGPKGSAKSFFACDLGLHVALGWKWNGHHVQRGTVLYVAGEGGRGFRRRLVALKCEYGIDSADFYLLPDTIDLLDPGDGFAALIQDLKAYRPQLILFDTLNRTFGGGDENSSRDMSLYVKHVEQICAETGAHCMVIHHTGKDESRGARGHSVLSGAIGTAFEVKKHGTVNTATVVKNRDGEEGQSFSYTLKKVALGVDEFNQPITSCVVIHQDKANEAQWRAPKAVRGQAKMLLRVLQNLIASDGVRPPASNQIPSTVKAVPLSLLRRCADKAALTASQKSNSRAHAFNRAQTALKLAGKIGVWNDWVWIVKEDSHARTDDEEVHA